MIISKMNVKNEQICLSNISFDFSKTGIYLITGPNGSGKSSVIKEILFGQYDVSFNTDEQYSSYQKNKASVLAYVPQNIQPIEMSVLNYLKLGNSKITENDLERFKHFLDIDYSLLFSSLSGGERIKCAILSAVLKNTPYIILDEPTNHMDNNSVKQLIELVNQLSIDKTFIICTHDPRFVVNSNCIYTIQDNKVVKQVQHSDKQVNMSIPSKINFEIKNIFKPLFNWIPSVGISVIVACMFITLLIRSDLFLKTNYNNEKLDSSNLICCYGLDGYVDSLTLTYASIKDITIDESLYQTCVDFDSIPSIAAIDGVDQILMMDETYYSRLFDNETSYLSLPEDVSNYFLGQYAYNTILQGLEEGRYPNDNQNEVVLSKTLLEQNHPNIDSDNAIGNTISIENQDYTIVGISYVDFYILSFSDQSDNYGFYIYNKDTYNDYRENIQDYIDYNNENNYNIEVGTLLLYCDDQMEEKVINQLIQKYPASLYYSKVLSNTLKQYYNHKTFIETIKRNMIYVIFGILATCLILYLFLKIDYPKINHLVNYYFLEKKIISGWFILQLIPIVIGISIALLYLICFCKYKSLLVIILLINGFSLFLVVGLFIFICFLYTTKKIHK